MTPIVFITSKESLPLTMVAMQSIVDTANPTTQYEIVLLQEGLDDRDIQTLLKFLPEQFTLTFLEAQQVLQEQIPTLEAHLFLEEPSSFYPVFLPELLPEAEKILYFSNDVLLKSDVQELLETSLGDCDTGACRSWQIHMHSPEFRHVPKDTLFDSGVLLMNASLWRKKGLTQDCMTLLQKKESHSLDTMLDEVLFEIMGDRVLFLPQSWNVLMIWFFIDNEIFDNYGFLQAVEEAGPVKLLHFTPRPSENMHSFLCNHFWECAETVELSETETAKDHCFQSALNTRMERAKISAELISVSVDKWPVFLEKCYEPEPKEALCFFGAGKDCTILLEIFRLRNLRPPTIICDNNEKMQGKQVEGIEVINLQEASKRYPNLLILITSRRYQKEIFFNLKEKVDESILFLPDWGEIYERNSTCSILYQ